MVVLMHIGQTELKSIRRVMNKKQIIIKNK